MTGEIDVSDEVLSREEMQERPPHILITNYSMMEYLLLRPKDDALFRDAQLRFIILDEAHIYRGATGIETSLLLRRMNAVLVRANAHVGYRVRDEIVFYLLNNREAGLLDENAAMDNEILQKILPRIHGSSASVKSMLCDLFKEVAGDYEGYQTQSNNTADHMLDMLRKNEHVKYPRSAEKIAFMVRRFEEDGFTSYWL